MTLSAEEKQNYFNAKNYNGENAQKFNSVLAKCMELVTSNYLGKAILDRAEYGQETTPNNYTVERIYIGNRSKTKGGHCGLISAVDGDKDPNNAHGEIYINADFIRKIIEELGDEKATIYLSNIVVHEFLHGNQRRQPGIVNEVETSRSGLNDNKTSNIDKLKLTEEEKYQIVCKNKDGWERMILTEAASMAAGLTVCMQLCNNENKDAIIEYALKDVKELGNVSKKNLDALKDVLAQNTQNEEQQQNMSLQMFSILVQGQMDNLREISGNKSLNLTFDNETYLNATYQECLFGKREYFDKAIIEINHNNSNLDKSCVSLSKIAEKKNNTNTQKKEKTKTTQIQQVYSNKDFEL